VGSLSLLQEIFPTQGSNPDLLHFRWILYQLPTREWLINGTPGYSFPQVNLLLEFIINGIFET